MILHQGKSLMTNAKINLYNINLDRIWFQTGDLHAPLLQRRLQVKCILLRQWNNYSLIEIISFQLITEQTQEGVFLIKASY